MRRVCVYCERSAPDDNLLCQELHCPAERAPRLLDAGEWLDNIEVVRLLALLRTSALYEARQDRQAVLLKVAHPDQVSVARFKREARLLATLGPVARNAHLPELLPPYRSTTVRDNPYGRAMLRGQLFFFCVWRHFKGTPLRDLLAERPQLWVYQVGWLLSDVARSLTLLHHRDLVHYTLCPAAVLVRFDERSGVPQALLADLGVAATRSELAAHWRHELALPGYLAPELIDAPLPPAHYAVDVYGLGMLLYELLAGRPAYPQQLLSDAELRSLVRQGRPLSTGRASDVGDLAALAEQAISPNQAARPRNAAQFAERLQTIVGATPLPSTGWFPKPRLLLVLVIGLLALAFLFAIAASVIPPGGS
jgi:serine/threonine protein kinase